MKIVVFKSKDNGQWYWHIESSNGKIVLQSEGYKRKSTLLKTVNSVKTKLLKAEIVFHGY